MPARLRLAPAHGAAATLSQGTWERLKIGSIRLEKPIQVYNVDGTRNSRGDLKRCCWLKVIVGRRRRWMKFYLTNLGKDRVILGYPFLTTFNPHLDWKMGKLRSGEIKIQTIRPREIRETKQSTTKGNTRYIQKMTITQNWAQEQRESHGKTEDQRESIPVEYWRHWKVFDEERAKCLPLRQQEDMVITLKPGAPDSIDCKAYPLNMKETDALKKFLNEEQEKGYIWQGSSPYTTPVFFVSKKDSDELRLVMDYRELNKWVVRDNNPLPNIRTALENLKDGELFSKFDIRWGYKNLRIKEGDQYKATFKTTFRTFVPEVTYFGLANMPPTFQRVIHEDLKPLLQKYPRNFGNYLDDTWVVTWKNKEGICLHREINHALLDLLEKRSYFLKMGKTEFEKEEIDLLGWRVKNGRVRIDPMKVEGLKSWPRTLKTVKQVHQILGVLRYLRPFIRGFADLARPLTQLTKKSEVFEWRTEHTKALDQLIEKVTAQPVLRCADPKKAFELEVDASTYGIGAILMQQDKEGKRYDVGYYSKALNDTERNYDVWDREFMAIVWGLQNWRHLLVRNPHPVKVYTDHTNLQYYRYPQKVNRRVARYISMLADYNIELKHLPRVKNRADPFSQRPDFDNGADDNKEVIALPDKLFAQIIETTALDKQIQRNQDPKIIKEWVKQGHEIQRKQGKWWKWGALVVTSPEFFAKTILQDFHDAPTAGHMGTFQTFKQVSKEYWWPRIKDFVKGYVRGCAVCQKNKSIARRNDPPLYPIEPMAETEPFKTISIDLIVKLPRLNEWDSILTVTNQGSTKAVILIPCRESMGTLDLAELYKTKVFPYIGLPSHVISDRDTCFTSEIFRELCELLKVKQNVSLAYHPQTDGQSKRTNQSVETALRIFCNYQQNDWSRWLPIVQYQLNASTSHTTGVAPFEAWIGYIPRAHQPEREGKFSTIEERRQMIQDIRERAQAAMSKAQKLWGREKDHKPYVKGEQVWLEGKNLRTSHPTVKLHPKHFGPFKITEILSKMTYRLNLPPTWKIHNAFHGSLLTPYYETPECGPNYLEPPPELVDGELEYEVEEILRTWCHGKGKNLQYLVKWKGYDKSQNTWEPKENVHAPDLVKEFYSANPTAIKELRMEKSEGHKKRKTKITYLRSLTMEPTSFSFTTPPLCYPSTVSMSEEEVDKLESLRLPSPMICDESPHSSIQGPHRDEAHSPTFSDYISARTCTPLPSVIVYTDTPEPEPHMHPNGGTEVDQNLPKDLEAAHPGPPFFHVTDISGHPPYDTIINGEQRRLPYVGCRELNGNVLQLGTDGFDRPLYAHEVHMDSAPFNEQWGVNGPEDFDLLAKDLMLNFVVNQALDRINNPGLTCEVARLRMLVAQLPGHVERAKVIGDLMKAISDAQQEYNSLNRAYLHQLEACKARLIDGQAGPHVRRMLEAMAREGRLGGSWYWPGIPGREQHPGRHYFAYMKREAGETPPLSWGEEPQTFTQRQMESVEKSLRTRRGRNRCRLCRVKGHFQKDCTTPHCKCRGVCKIPSEHKWYWPQTCGLKRVGKPGHHVTKKRVELPPEDPTAGLDLYEQGLTSD